MPARIDGHIAEQFLAHTRADETIEIGMHPALPPGATLAADVTDGWNDPLAASRNGELALLCSAAFAESLRARNVRLGRLAALAARAREHAA